MTSTPTLTTTRAPHHADLEATHNGADLDVPLYLLINRFNNPRLLAARWARLRGRHVDHLVGTLRLRHLAKNRRRAVIPTKLAPGLARIGLGIPPRKRRRLPLARAILPIDDLLQLSDAPQRNRQLPLQLGNARVARIR